MDLDRLRGRSWSIQAQFLFYSLTLLVPALVFSGLMIVRSWSLERSSVEREIEDVLQSIAISVDREFAATTSTLMALASSPSLAEGELKSFYGQAKAAVEISGADVILIDKSGRQLVNTREAWGAAPSRKSPCNWQEVFELGRPAVSDLIVDDGGQQVYCVTVPVKTRNRTTAVLSAVYSARRILDLIDIKQLDEEWIARVTDRSGVIVAMTKDFGKYVGKPLHAGLAQEAQSPGLMSTTSLEGVPVLRATTQSQLSGWTIAASVPTAIANRKLVQSWLLVGTMAASFGILSALLALSFGRRISDPVRRLVAGADALGKGQDVPQIASSITEVADVAEALSRAAETRLLMERSLRQSEARLRRLIDNLFAFVGLLDLEGRLIECNKAPLEAASLSRADVIGIPYWDCYWWSWSPAVQSELEEAFRRARTGETVRYDVEVRVSGTERIAVDFQLAPLMDDDGRIILVVPSGIDVTERKRREEHIHLLMREITHRSKNLLAVIQAMARQSKIGSKTVAEFEQRFSARLQALAASHDLLVQREWRGVSLADIVTSQLGHYLDQQGSQISLSGPEIVVTPEAAQNVGLAVHELSTNAAKYGALSVAKGHIDVRWDFVRDDGSGERLRITWIEKGGPPVVTPTHRSFGHVVVEEIAPRALQGEARLEFEASGVRWTLEFPSLHVIDEVTASGRWKRREASRSA